MGIAAAGWLQQYLHSQSQCYKEMPFKLALSQFSLATQFWTKQLTQFSKKVTTFGITGMDYCHVFADK